MKFNMILADECLVDKIVFNYESSNTQPEVFEHASASTGWNFNFKPQESGDSDIGTLSVEGIPSPFTRDTFIAIRQALEDGENASNKAEDARVNAVLSFFNASRVPLGSDEPHWNEDYYR